MSIYIKLPFPPQKKSFLQHLHETRRPELLTKCRLSEFSKATLTETPSQTKYSTLPTIQKHTKIHFQHALLSRPQVSQICRLCVGDISAQCSLDFPGLLHRQAHRRGGHHGPAHTPPSINVPGSSGHWIKGYF